MEFYGQSGQKLKRLPLKKESGAPHLILLKSCCEGSAAKLSVSQFSVSHVEVRIASNITSLPYVAILDLIVLLGSSLRAEFD